LSLSENFVISEERKNIKINPAAFIYLVKLEAEVKQNQAT
jgi:hypothetical protein